MQEYKVIKRQLSASDRLVVISPNAIYLVTREKGYYCPVRKNGVFVIEPDDVEFSVDNISAEKLSSLEKQHDVAIIETNNPNPDLHALGLAFDLKYFEQAAYLFNKYANE